MARVLDSGVAKPPVLWREELRRAYKELRGAQLTPWRAALAVALGLFIGSIPIYGLHTPLVLGICLLLQLDGLLAWIASNVSNPLFSVPLLTAEFQLGAYIHTGSFVRLHDFDAVREMGLQGALYLFTGAIPMAAGLALIGGLLVYLFTALRQRRGVVAAREPYVLPANAPSWWHAVERVARRYAPVGEISTAAERTRFNYVRIKLLTDPVTQMIADLFGQDPEALGDVLDVGTGRGQLPVVLLELGRARSVHGVDWDQVKVESARSAAAVAPALSASFEVGDARSFTLPSADTVLLIDVIHYLSIAEQDALLREAAAAVRVGGRLIVREADTERGLRSWMTLLEERFFTTLRFNRGDGVRFRPARDIVALLEGAGLRCRVQPAWGGTPFSNVLVVAERRAAGLDAEDPGAPA